MMKAAPPISAPASAAAARCPRYPQSTNPKLTRFCL
ncbi:unnamed protein product [Linum tenue]|uniref:Uncharacterized protein n=1 Tax=Linum tenue TaxID=586396 RepID=A0AAV0HR44_9ROSI|nr:unnamed protein product [Linum tenue]